MPIIMHPDDYALRLFEYIVHEANTLVGAPNPPCFSHTGGRSWACLGFGRPGPHSTDGAEIQVTMDRATGAVRIWSWTPRQRDSSWEHLTDLRALADAFGASRWLSVR